MIRKGSIPPVAFVIGAIVASMTSISAASETPGSAFEGFRRVLASEAPHARDPWSLCHAFLAMGPGYMLDSGGVAADYLISRFLREDPAAGPHFDLKGTGDLLGETHPHLVLKSFVEMKAKPELSDRLARAAVEKLAMPRNHEEWDDSAWLLTALFQLPGFKPTTRAGGDGAPLGDIAMGALEQVETADKLVEKNLMNGVANFDRPSGGGSPTVSGIWAYTCGGQHLLQAVIVAYGRGFIPSSARLRVAERLKTFMLRIEGETHFRERELKGALAAGVDPKLAQHNTTLHLLKLYGHSLETLAKAREAGLAEPEVIHAKALEIEGHLDRILTELKKQIDLSRLLPLLRNGQPDSWRKWFGDGCHAVHGVSLWREGAAVAGASGKRGRGP